MGFYIFETDQRMMDDTSTALATETLPSLLENSISLQNLFCDIYHKINIQSLFAFPVDIFLYLTL